MSIQCPAPESFLPLAGEIAPALRAWFRANRRDLPWRRSRDPYHIWVSEIMLQQTTVKTVIPYYHAFLERFPTVHALAGAPLDDVLARWSGLGYYSRARNLHRAAGVVEAEHGGCLPSDPEKLRALPGIGEYTAGAVLSIAFGLSHPLVDGNVIRVLSRLAGWKGDPKAGPLQRKVKHLAAILVPSEHPGDHNEGLMELGATVCSPLEPRCDVCPLRPWCRAGASGEAASYPGVAKRAASMTKVRAVLVATHGESVLLVRREETSVMQSLWELPLFDESPTLAEMLATLELGGADPGPETSVTHTIMNQRFKVTVRCARLPGSGGSEKGQWTPLRDIPGLPLTGLSLKILKKMRLESL